jgi:FMN phosphatase YigB (HAD superfamily)
MKRLFRFLYALLILAAPLSATPEFTPKNTIFVWDIHDVMLRQDSPKIAKLILQIPLYRPSLSFLKNIPYYSWHSLKGETVPKEIFLQAARAAKNNQLASLVIKIANAQKLMLGTPQIIAALKELGFTNYIASNIDNEAFAQLLDPAINPELAPFFLNNFDIAGSQSVDYGASMENVIHKPNPAYFTQFIERNHIDLKKTHVIFIDDRQANITSAQKLGFMAIRFIDAKQLIEKLNCMGIPVSIAPTQAAIAAPI